MSGSPVYVDGKLVGAVAYGFPFSKETIGGITPIAEMIEATRAGHAARGLRPLHARRWARGGPAAPLDADAVVAALRRPLPRRDRRRRATARAACRRRPRRRRRSRRWPLPLVFSGFDPATFEWARGVFSGLGFTPVIGHWRRAGSLPERAARPAAGRRRRHLADRRRPRPLGHRHHHPHRRRPRLRVRPSLLQPGAHAVPDEARRTSTRCSRASTSPGRSACRRRAAWAPIEQDRTTADRGHASARRRA